MKVLIICLFVVMKVSSLLLFSFARECCAHAHKFGADARKGAKFKNCSLENFVFGAESCEYKSRKFWYINELSCLPFFVEDINKIYS